MQPHDVIVGRITHLLMFIGWGLQLQFTQEIEQVTQN